VSEQADTGSNGTSAPQSPAPGVTSQTPAPKSGEGAVAPKPALGSTTPAWQPIKLKLPVRDGEPEEVELASEEEAVRTAIRAKQFDRANKERLQLQRQLEDMKARAARGDPEALKALGFDPEAYFTKRLEEEARRAGLSEQDRAIDDARRRTEAAERKAEAIQQQMRAHLEEQAEARAWDALEPRLKAAMAQHEMIGDTYAMERIERVAQEFISAGLDVPPEQVVAEAAARDKEQFQARVGKVPAAALRKLLSPEQFKELAGIYLQEWKAARGATTATPPPQKAVETKTEASQYIDEYEARRKFGF